MYNMPTRLYTTGYVFLLMCTARIIYTEDIAEHQSLYNTKKTGVAHTAFARRISFLTR